MNILVAEDEKRLAEALRFLLEREKYQVDVADDGELALSYIEGPTHYDLFIFDIMMPHINGLDLVSRIRKNHVETPILMLTALSEISDKVVGLDRGADDYMTKPFQPDELLARVRALTRRKGDVVLDELRFADLTLDLSSRKLTCALDAETQEVRLSETEYEVLSLLLRNSGQVISKEQLMMQVWGYDTYIEDNNVEAYISFLRKKLRFLHSRVQIDTIRSVGYVLTDAEKEK